MRAVRVTTESSGRNYRTMTDGCKFFERISDVLVEFMPETDEEAAVIKCAQAATGDLGTKIRCLFDTLPDKIQVYARCDGRLELRVMAEGRWTQIKAGRDLYSVRATKNYATELFSALYPKLSELCQPHLPHA